MVVVEYLELEEISPQKAREILDNNRYERQREPRPHNVERLTIAIQQGTFIPDLIQFHRYNGRDLLTDGQHRLLAIEKSGRTVKLPVMKSRCDSEDEVEAAYAHLDRGEKRQPNDVLTNTPLINTLGFSKRQLGQLNAAVPFIMTGFSNSNPGSHDEETRDIDHRASILENYKEEAGIYLSLLEGGDPKINTKLRTAPILAIALVTLRGNRDKATAFWSALSRNSGLLQGTPQHKLANYLLTNSKEGGNHTILRKVSECWNSYYANKSMSGNGIKINLDKPLEIKGVETTALRLGSITQRTVKYEIL